jgi:hypothetical protein
MRTIATFSLRIRHNHRKFSSNPGDTVLQGRRSNRLGNSQAKGPNSLNTLESGTKSARRRDSDLRQMDRGGTTRSLIAQWC